MRGKQSFPKRSKELTMVQQHYSLKQAFPDSNGSFRRNESLVWEGFIQPTPLSPRYSVRIQYTMRQRPKVFVLSPKLETREGERLPHTFGGNELCLFMFKYYEWSSSRHLVGTIIPWTSLWLYYYEIWRSTGKWMGGGEHLEGPKNING